jgi:hypothetical protein
MWKKLSAVLTLAALSFTAPAGGVETAMEYSVQVSATVQSSPARITLHWLQDTLGVPLSYVVYRRAPGVTSWGTGITLSGSNTTFVDPNVAIGIPYEYQIVKKTAAYTGYGYIYSGIHVPTTENRGKLLLVVENTHADDLANELYRLQLDLVGDGWTVIRLDVNRADSAANIKQLIKAHHAADPENVKALFLFGHVPVPYSGDIVPDGHYREHEGAWPCDGYYADMDGVWTDNRVKVTLANDPRNHNVPGDGKFDQCTFPAPLKLIIGRVDLANMPGRTSFGGPATFPSERELLRNYLNKDHSFRKKITSAPQRGIVGDYFGTRDGEAFAASGWRNFAPFFGGANITSLKQEGTWIRTLSTNAYLWAYGCGSGSFTSIGGMGSVGRYADGVTTELVTGNIQAVFTMLYGSWLGDWDSEDNIQRAVLATRDYGLTCAWSGRPHWFLQHMALGEPIGFSTLITQNDGFTGLYKNQRNSCAGWTHIALMGDPTLRMHVVAPPANVNATISNNDVTLAWNPAHEDAIAGYHVYRATNPNGPFSRLNISPVTATGFVDPNGASGNYTYMIRAVKLEVSASGSYLNLSEGEFAAPNIPQNITSTTNAPTIASIPERVAALPRSISTEKLTSTGTSFQR